ncbi:hypothetical protein F5878DRAFT_632764 [Lentinula raphanica]|uniref:Uncharacterized protein n=1 Tax=Lentinula raphanica TaxID=153919 RepID=A0AA38U6U8_9AGAR|nr:hypothetical protein F5878DRAFT_632764 [Lentinula raphanica]
MIRFDKEQSRISYQRYSNCVKNSIPEPLVFCTPSVILNIKHSFPSRHLKAFSHQTPRGPSPTQACHPSPPSRPSAPRPRRSCLPCHYQHPTRQWSPRTWRNPGMKTKECCCRQIDQNQNHRENYRQEKESDRRFHHLDRHYRHPHHPYPHYRHPYHPFHPFHHPFHPYHHSYHSYHSYHCCYSSSGPTKKQVQQWTEPSSLRPSCCS